MQAVHHLLNAGGVVPPMEIEQVDIVDAQLFQRFLDEDVRGLDVVTGVHGFRAKLRTLTDLVVGGILKWRRQRCPSWTSVLCNTPLSQ